MANDYKKYILSTGTHYISNSGSDENGGTHGGRAGDQNGKEWQLRSWYKRPWTCILRWPDMDAATLIAQLAIDAALNDKIGYDQYQRDTFWKEVKKVGYLPKNIRTACEEDCTAGVNGVVHCAAYLLNIAALKSIQETGVNSRNMRKLFKAAGFKVLTDSKYLSGGNYLLPGDVLLYDNHHAATNVTCGKKVRDQYAYHDVIDHLDEYTPTPTPTPEPGKLGDRVLMYGDRGDDVRELQADLMLLGYDLPKYGADGDFGSETARAVRHFQQEHQLPEDGVMDEEDYDALFAALDGARVVVITGGSVNVRSAPNTSARVLGVVHEGDRLPWQGIVQNTDGRDWYLIEYAGENGWVSSKYSELSDSGGVAGGRICDVAKYQGKIDWNKLAPELAFVIIKASGLYANGADPYYVRNVTEAVKRGVPFHAYTFLYCKIEAEAKRDAGLFYDTVKAGGHDPLFWVLDCEAE